MDLVMIPFVEKKSLFCDNALKGDHLLQLANVVTMPFVQAITILYDNALRGNHFYSTIYISL